VSAAGVPNLVDGSLVKRGAVLIDVGINMLNGKVVGDILHRHLETYYRYTPVPGGVGPVTVAMLMHNLLKAYHEQ
jgi:methylenetetrahydrofolate dehydrogenase (NADP+)/methenyltetrahydrofolate cyclohydrolase